MGYTGDQLGYHAGLLAASFCGAQFCTAVPWGMISDRFGRKPTIIVGTLGSGLGMLAFGLARTFPQGELQSTRLSYLVFGDQTSILQNILYFYVTLLNFPFQFPPPAIMARVFSGLLSGNLGVVKSLLTEITDDTNRGAAFAYMSLAWAIGTVIAPLAGGLLCKPAEKYPSVFPEKHGLFVEFPYLLPCLMCMGWTVCSAIFCIFFMKETRFATKSSSSSSLTVVGTTGSAEERANMLNNGKGIEMVKLTNGSSGGSGGGGRRMKGGYAQVAGGATSDDEGEERKEGSGAEEEEDDEMVGMDIEFGLKRSHSSGSGGGGDMNSAGKFSVLQANLKHAADSDSGPVVAGGESNVSSNNGAAAAHLAAHSPLHSPKIPNVVNGKEVFVIGGDEEEEEEVEEQVKNDDEKRRKAARRGGGDDVEEGGGSGSGSGGNVTSNGYAALNAKIKTKVGHTMKRLTPPTSPASTATTIDDSIDSATEEEEEDDEESDDDTMCCASAAESRDGSGSAGLDSSSHNLKDSDDNSSSMKSGSGKGAVRGKLTTSQVLRQKVVVLVTSTYGMLCAASILMEETLPLFLKASIADGGFGFDSMQIGALLSISGCVMLVFTLFFLPIISRRSKFWMFEVGIYGAVPVAILMPFIALLNRTVLSQLDPTLHAWILWIVLPFITVCKSLFACFAFSAVMIQVNHSVHDEYLGAVNGLGQSLAALARAIGPAMGGAFWSLSTKHHFVYLNFILIAVIFSVCLYMDKSLPPSLDYKKRVKKGSGAAAPEGDGGMMMH